MFQDIQVVLIVDADTFTTSGGSFSGLSSNSNFLTVGKTYKLTIDRKYRQVQVLALGNLVISGNEYGSGFSTHIFCCNRRSGYGVRQNTSGSTNITSLA